MGNEVPSVTVGIACFNGASTIERALRSAIGQDYGNHNVIVVDDASVDSSLQIARRIAATHRRVSVLRHDVNLGYAASLNTIIEHATGDIIAIFDSDDESAPDRLTKQVQRLVGYEANNPDVPVMVYANRRIMQNGKPPALALAIGREAVEPSGLEVARYILGIHTRPDLCWGAFGSCTLMARRATFLSVGPFDTAFRRSAELDYAIRAARRDTHFIAVNEPLVTQHKTVAPYKAGRVGLRYGLLLRRKHRDLLGTFRRSLGSRAAVYSKEYGRTRNKWRSRLCLLACLVLMPEVLPRYLAERRST
jgi:glycosyltransferase involved in cell wall biosynthesis